MSPRGDGSPERGPWSRVLPLPKHLMDDGGLFFIPSAQVEKKIGICRHTEVCGDPELIGVGTLDPSCCGVPGGCRDQPCGAAFDG